MPSAPSSQPDAATGEAIFLGNSPLRLRDFIAISYGARVAVDPSAFERIRHSSEMFERSLRAGTTVYGVTTGYGSSSGMVVPPEERPSFQLATVRASAWGTGAPLNWSEARGAWIAKAACILTGRTGARAELVEVIVALLNAGFAPLVPSVGSLCASGDLIPSAHLALPIVGEGSVLTENGANIPSLQALAIAGTEQAVLGPRDGLSLVNGTAVTTSLSCHACTSMHGLLTIAAQVVAAGLEAKGGHVGAFAPEVVECRPYEGARIAARDVREALIGAPQGQLGRSGLHDSYAWRCVPQVHGVAHSALDWATKTCDVELMACTDNPVVTDDGSLYSGGNFHGAPLGVAMDTLALAVGEVAALSRQRTAHFAGLETSHTERIALDMLLTGATASLLEFTSAGPATGRWLPIDAAEDHVSNATLAARRAQFAIESTFCILAAEALVIAATYERTGTSPRSAAGVWLVELVKVAGPRPLTLGGARSPVLMNLAELLASRADVAQTIGAPM